MTLNAKVLDGGQQIVSVTLDTSRLGIKPSDLSKGTFTVHAKGTDPYGLDPATVFGTYDVDREVTGVSLDRRGRIVIDSAHGFGVPGAGTLASANGAGRNIVLEQTYTITQNRPIRLANGRSVTSPPPVRAPSSTPRWTPTVRAGLAGPAYRLFTPSTGRGARPLIVRVARRRRGRLGQGAGDNDLALQANCGALGFQHPRGPADLRRRLRSRPAGHRLLAERPGVMGYSAKLKKLIDSVVAKHRIDRSRIYVAGASNGGYMAPRLAVDHLRLFAAVVPVCPALVFEGTRMISDAELEDAALHTDVDRPGQERSGAAVHRERPADGEDHRQCPLTAYPDVT